MFLRVLSLAFLFLLSSINLDAVVIVIHGSFATTRSWWTPKGAFFKEIERQANCFGEVVVPFGWSGYPTAEHIGVAGMALAKLILSYRLIIKKLWSGLI